ncbi:hypothetical protein LTR97_004048 [Elasticomyces elasticus]|uniref:Uncharacterized protein n=1 Tax=Elasticomyces elasticus TaxID=574655 RepID=A0AAN7ZUY2_9PEZI|nr:hypothetical protein LTR97_004048 [Elasticomyces elasticus]
MMPNFQDPPPYATPQGAIATKPIIVTLRHHRLTVGPAGEKRWGPLLKTYHDAVSSTSTTTRPELMRMLRQRAVRWSNVQRLEEAKNRAPGTQLKLAPLPTSPSNARRGSCVVRLRRNGCFEHTADLENTTSAKHSAGSGHEDSVERRKPSSGKWESSLERKANYEHTTTRSSPANLGTDVYNTAHV